MRPKLFAPLTLITLLVSTTCFAQTITWDITQVKTFSNKKWIEITSNITAASDGSVTTTLLGGSDGGSGTAYDVKGMYLYQICVADAGTDPTNDSDLYLYQHGSTSSYKDVLGGAGKDTIDAGATLDNCFQPYIGGTEAVMPIYGLLYQAISGNSANGAQIQIKYYFME